MKSLDLQMLFIAFLGGKHGFCVLSAQKETSNFPGIDQSPGSICCLTCFPLSSVRRDAIVQAALAQSIRPPVDLLTLIGFYQK